MNNTILTALAASVVTLGGAYAFLGPSGKRHVPLCARPPARHVPGNEHIPGLLVSWSGGAAHPTSREASRTCPLGPPPSGRGGRSGPGVARHGEHPGARVQARAGVAVRVARDQHEGVLHGLLGVRRAVVAGEGEQVRREAAVQFAQGVRITERQRAQQRRVAVARPPGPHQTVWAVGFGWGRARHGQARFNASCWRGSSRGWRGWRRWLFQKWRRARRRE